MVELAAPAADPPVPALSGGVTEDPVVERQTPAPRLAKRSGRKPGRSSAAPVSAPASGVEEGGCAGAIVEALRKHGPLTSVEVVKKSGYSDGAVYSCLKGLRTAGRVEMVDDESDGLRKNKLVAGGKE